MAHFEQGTLVRFYHERQGGPVHRVAFVSSDGMVELEDMGGFFAPHLFALADDIASGGRGMSVEAECRAAWELAMYDDTVRAIAAHFMVPVKYARWRAIELGLIPTSHADPAGDEG